MIRRKPLAERSRYARRERDTGFMLWVKHLPCVVPILIGDDLWTPCAGPIEADHCGDRGLGQKADDRSAAPLCRGHHRERTDMRGTFKDFTAATMREFRHAAIAWTQARWTAANPTTNPDDELPF